MGEPARTDEAPVSQEYQLLEYVERLARNRDGRVAMHIHLSRLRAWLSILLGRLLLSARA